MTYPVFLGAVVITTANNRIRWVEGASTGNADIVPGTYYLRGDAAADDLCAAIRTAIMAANASANNYALVPFWKIGTTEHSLIQITRTGGADTFQLLKDGNETFDYRLIGYSASTALSSAAKVSDIAPSASWVSNDGFLELDDFSTKIAPMDKVSSGRVTGVERSSRSHTWRVGLGFVHKGRLKKRTKFESDGDTLENFIDQFGATSHFELHSCDISSGTTLVAATSSTLLDKVVFDQEIIENFDPERVGDGIDLYDVNFLAHRVV